MRASASPNPRNNFGRRRAKSTQPTRAAKLGIESLLNAGIEPPNQISVPTGSSRYPPKIVHIVA